MITFGWRWMNFSVASRRRVLSTPTLEKILLASPFFCSNSAFNKCSVSTIWCLFSFATSGDETMACQAISVNSCCVICHYITKAISSITQASIVHNLKPNKYHITWKHCPIKLIYSKQWKSSSESITNWNKSQPCDFRISSKSIYLINYTQNNITTVLNIKHIWSLYLQNN